MLGTVPEHAREDERGVEHRDALHAALATLNARERAVVVLRHVEDLSEQQTALELGLPLGTVKSINSRALSKLRRTRALLDDTTGRTS